MERHLAAIIAGDIVGYSALMERDESDTFERLKAVRKELIEPEIERHHGRIFKHMGDGFLAEFSSVVEAVECAVALQNGLVERGASSPEVERIQMRIGVNLGEVIIDGEDRFGEGVNVAARLEQLAQPGDIYVTNLATNTIDVYSPDGTKTVFASGLNSPQGLVFDRDNNLYVADGGTGSIFKYDTSGTQTVFYTGL
ncbi:MAG TPA: adenylate/guanylate cyclase domain-containing protein, partial [Aestuariivirgaceae bacterium]|nr:adenylate/guanylate cyclase domain-containing protein [Aestuariivirgaceae bacterium]